MKKEYVFFKIQIDDSNRRLDRILRKFLNNIPLSGIYSAIRHGKIQINGKKTSPSYITKYQDELKIEKNLISQTDNFAKQKNLSTVKLNSDKIPEIILQTKDLIFINKPINITVHGENSLTELVKALIKPVEQSLSFEIGPLHRLDKGTSGIITYSKTLNGAQIFSSALKNGKIEKYYLGIVEGTNVIPVFKNKIENKDCLCFTKTIAVSKQKKLSLVLFNLVTGRKHQIRIQCEKFGCPLLNDKKYGSKYITESKNYFLHAVKLKFKEHFFADLPQEIKSPIPLDFQKIVNTYFEVNLKTDIFKEFSSK